MGGAVAHTPSMAVAVAAAQMPWPTDLLPPAELRARDQWVCWRLEERDGKATKVPYQAQGQHQRADSTRPETWSSFTRALAYHRANPWTSGIGYVLSADDPFVGVDLDHCRDPESGALLSWAQKIVKRLDSYTEITPSRAGLRIFVRGELPPHGRKKGHLEMYSQARFLTVTGERLPNTPPTIEDRHEALLALHADTWPPKPPPTNGQVHANRQPIDLDDAALLRRAKEAQNGQRFWALWNGDWSSHYDSQSVADLALCSHLAFWTGADTGRMDSLFRQSSLYRDKWDSRRGDTTYGAITLAKALEGLTETYAPAGDRLVVPTSPNGLHTELVLDEVTGEPIPPLSDYPIVRVADALNPEDRDSPQLIDGLIWRGRVHWDFSDPGSGKTLWACCQGLHISAGKALRRRVVMQGPVLMLQEDSPISTAVEYIETLADIYKIDLETIPFYVNKVQGLRINSKEGLEKAKQAVLACPEMPIFLILDAAERLVPSDKFSSGELDPFDQFLRWCIGQGITPKVLDHTNRSGRADPKAKAKGKEQAKPDPMDLIYGGRPKTAIADVMTYLDGSLRAGTVQVTWQKFRASGEAPPPYALTFDSETGFSLVGRPDPITNTAQQGVFDYLTRANDWRTKAQIVDEARKPSGLAMEDKTVQRALSALTTKRWLAVQGETNQRQWQAAAAAGDFFQ